MRYRYLNRSLARLFVLYSSGVLHNFLKTLKTPPYREYQHIKSMERMSLKKKGADLPNLRIYGVYNTFNLSLQVREHFTFRATNGKLIIMMS